jgi:hypothetical protein
VTLRFVNPALAEQIDNTLSAVVAFSSIFAFTRTDVNTSTGSPAAEVPPLMAILSTAADPVTSVPGDGTPPTTTLN